MSISDSAFSGKGVITIARNASYLLGGQWLTNVMGLIYAIGLTRYLGPELYGLFNYGLAWYLAFLPMAGLGIGVILSREVGRNRNQSTDIVAQTFTIRLLAAIIAAITCGFVGCFSEGLPKAKVLLLIFPIALIGRALAMWTEQVFTAFEANQYSFRLQTIFRPLEVIFGLSALFLEGGVVAIAVVHTISWWLQALSGLALARRHLVVIKLAWSRRDLTKTLVQGLPIGLGVILIGWFKQGPLVLFRHLAGASNSLGQLALVLQVSIIISSLHTVVSRTSLPVLSRSVAKQDGKDRLFAETMLRFILIFGSAVILAGFGAGSWIVHLIFGPQFKEAGNLLGPALCLLIPSACGNAISRVYLARGQYVLPTVCAGAGAFVFTLSMPWFVSTMATVGAILSAGSGIGVWALSLIWTLAKSGDLNLRQAVYRPGAVVLFATVIFLVLKPVSTWFSMTISWIFLFGGSLAFNVFTPEDRLTLSKLKSKLFSPSDTILDKTEPAKGKQ